jgi:hypothetical protein
LLSREARFFLASAGGPEAEEGVRAFLSEGVDWDRVLQLAAQDGVQGPFSRRMRTLGGVVFDATGLATLRDLERAADFRMRYLEQRLRATLDALAAAGVAALLLEGTALGYTSYGSFTDLHLSDIDLMVRPDQLGDAAARLRDCGWQQRGGRDAPSLADTRAPAMDVGLRLHTDVLPAHRPFAVSAADVWRAAEQLESLPRGVLVPSRVDRLLHCCIRFAWTDMFRRSAWRAFRDVTVVVAERESAMDWPAVVAAARRTGSASCCYWTLRLARRHAELPLSDRVLVELRPAGSPRLSSFVERHLSQQLLPAERVCPARWIERVMWWAAIRPGASGHGAVRPERAPEPRPRFDPGAWWRYFKVLTL